jgi:flavodoxin
MRIGVVFHSKTGTTSRFAEKIAEKLTEKGHTVDLVQLETDVPVKSGSVRHTVEFSVVNAPDCSGYDALLAGGPVWAFSASPVIHEFLRSLSGLSGKRFVPFVTAGFPFRFMGANQALDLMEKTAGQSGADVEKGPAVLWMLHNRQREMEQGASEIAARF